jgi:hypothetical protein
MDKFYCRLNQIKARLSSSELLNNAGLGNEIGFYIFEYPPESELELRTHLDQILDELPIKIVRIDLFRLLVDYLKRRKLLDSAIEKQKTSGDLEMFRSLKGALDEEKRIAPEIVSQMETSHADLLVITGVGSAYPLLRTHRLLNCLQPLLKRVPLVVFYPGKYTGQSLSLFGRLADDNYYRAFQLIS